MIGEEQLMAYADGELSADEAAAVEAAVAADPALKARLERHRQLRTKLQGAFQDVMEEPAPQQLRTVVGGGRHGSAELVDLEAVRHAKEQLKLAGRGHKRPAWTPWALAAGLAALALIVGAPLLLKSPARQQLVAMGASGMTAQGPLARALDRELASEPKAGERIAIGLTFKDRSGAWCRSFTATADATAGLACRDGQAWRVRVLAKTTGGTSPSGPYQVAGSSTPAAVQAAIDASLAGEPLTAAAERSARDSRWR